MYMGHSATVYRRIDILEHLLNDIDDPSIKKSAPILFRLLVEESEELFENLFVLSRGSTGTATRSFNVTFKPTKLEVGEWCHQA